jgi:hypothetical protein
VVVSFFSERGGADLPTRYKLNTHSTTLIFYFYFYFCHESHKPLCHQLGRASWYPVCGLVIRYLSDEEKSQKRR